MTARKYNPGFLSVEELVETFCVRMVEYESLMEAVRECSSSANTHQIVIGPRGSGKTSLLLRVAAEIRRDGDLSARFFPIVFAEESYEVSTTGEFWLEGVFRLAEQAPHMDGVIDLHRTFEELRTIQDDRTLEDRCLGVLQDFADRHEKRLVLIVENMNMMFRDMSDIDAGWRLRKILQTEPRIVLLASATSRFGQIDHPEEALYEQLRGIRLDPLDTEDCATLWQTVSGQARAPQTIRALRILTGGSPRLLTIVARFGANLSFHELMADLLDLVDDHTEYFKSHLDALPAQERKVYLALARLWKPANAREIADQARIGTSICSAQLARLVDRGVVEVSGGSARRRLYYLTERLYNIYYLMRRAHGPAPLVDALIRFMEAYYSTEELKEFGARMLREAQGFDGDALVLSRLALERLTELPSLEAHREDLLSLAAPRLTYTPSEFSAGSPAESAARMLMEKAFTLAESGRLQDAVAIWDEIVRIFGASDTPEDLQQVSLALVSKGKALFGLGRAEEALAVLDEAVQRSQKNDSESSHQLVAMALVGKGEILSQSDRHVEALAAWREIAQRFGGYREPLSETMVAAVLVRTAATLNNLKRYQEALEACDEVLERFTENSPSVFNEDLAAAMIGRGHALIALKRVDEAINTWIAVAERFGKNDSPGIVEQVASALANIGTALAQTGRLEEALTAFNEVVKIYKGSDAPVLREVIARCLTYRGHVLAAMKRETEALSSWGEAIKDFETGCSREEAELFCSALMNKAEILYHAGRRDEPLELWGNVVERFVADDRPAMLDMVAHAQLKRGALLEQSGRYEEALAVWQQVEERFGNSTEPELSKRVASAFVSKGATLVRMNRLQDAIEVWNDVLRRYGRGDASLYLEEIASAVLNRVPVLNMLNRPDEALDACEEALQLFGDRDEHYGVKVVAYTLVNKGALLVALERIDEGFAAWDEAVRRFEASDVPALREAAEMALSRRAQYELTRGRTAAAVALLDRALLPMRGGVPDSRVQGHLMRARAHLAEGEGKASVTDVEMALSILPDLNFLPRDVLVALADLSADIGPEMMCNMIKTSPAAALLLPLRTALERELGLKPRVAREVVEIAEDIRRDLLTRPNGKGERRMD